MKKQYRSMMMMDMPWVFLRLVLIISCILGIHVHGSTVAGKGCPTHCGDVKIPYPFDVGVDDCYMSKGFKLTCNNTYVSPKLFVGNVEVIEITTETPQIKVSLPTSYQCYNNSSSITDDQSLMKLKLNNSPFRISHTENVFTGVGCDTMVFINETKGLNYTGGCISMCNNIDSVSDRNCSGIGCCQTSIPAGIQTYDSEFGSRNNHYVVESFNPCSFSFMVQKSNYSFSKTDLKMEKNKKFPVVMNWAIRTANSCQEAKANNVYACVSNHSECDKSHMFDDDTGYTCSCSEGYHGNPYLKDGCKDINECTKSLCADNGVCKNNRGNFTCTCKKGTKGDPYDKGCFKPRNLPGSAELLIGLSVGVSFFFLTISCFFWVYRRRQYMRLKQKFYQQHGGPFMQQLLSTEAHDNHSNFRIFSKTQLQRATDNYDPRHILGKGGHGTVYKGVLDDGSIVAVKKSIIVDESSSKEFAKEMLILSRINHVNVVKLLGICLEVEIPMIVYEFASNGTLFHYIHHRNLHQPPPTWSFRLKVLAESAKALSYMHSEASPSILHGDVKPSNILLDNTYTAKVSDFGTSTLAPKDKSKFMTKIQGTYGYLDPDFLRTGELTDKSDVYSFGVIMVELLTGKKALYLDDQENEKILVLQFQSFYKEKKIVEILDNDILNQGNPTYQIEDVVNIAEKCLSVTSEERPTMTFVAEELEGLRRLETHPWTSQENNQEMEVLIPITSMGSSLTSGYPKSEVELGNVDAGM